MGSSVYIGEAISSATPSLVQDIGCRWIMSFTGVAFPGNYHVEIFKMWLNELAEPEDNIRKRGKTERINDGMVVNLGGVGSHPNFIINATLSYYNFDGYIAVHTFY
jgi:hypothetical protein